MAVKESFDSALLAYEEVRSRCRDKSATLLLGNGFSIACDKVFTYRSLYETAVEANLSKSAQKVFQRLGTNNFEGVMRLLEESHWVAHSYGLVGPHDSPCSPTLKL